ncbi:hypothetical protein M9H77_13965 [Catharanthus roseus]|uniref:Uncharacterized protein n=1 Tax=Catharanthus roseus TaxID=4058 RepID=A0ACC0BLY1_CATRO|nr:hypothetical protein M9H77_13965 [Catharanthus roseus]
MPRKTVTSSKRAQIIDPSSLETDPFIPPFPNRITGNRIELERTLDPTMDNQIEISKLFTSLGWGRMISRSGIYYPSLVKEFYTNITQKNKKDLINIKTTVKGVNITLDHTLLTYSVSIPNTGEKQVTTTSSDIINGDTISHSCFEYNETERRWIARSGLSRRRTWSYTSKTRLTPLESGGR